MLAPHSCPPGQAPQVMVPLHPSPVWPQVAPFAAHVVVMQPVPQTLGTPAPPHVWPGVVQVPQSRRQPQPSPTWPQFKPFCAQVLAAGHVPQPVWPPVELVEWLLVPPVPAPPTPPSLPIPVRAPHAAASATTQTTHAQKVKDLRMKRA
jgi:hypothetical protein